MTSWTDSEPAGLQRAPRLAAGAPDERCHQTKGVLRYMTASRDKREAGLKHAEREIECTRFGG